MTQWLLQEAAFVALDVEEAQAVQRAQEGAAQRARLEAAARRQVSGGVH